MQEMDRKGLEKPPRVKWAGLGRRIGALTTPVPRWKVLSNKLDEVIAMAKSAGIIRPVEPPTPSARKLGASLWELQDFPLPASVPACLYTPSPNWIPYNSSPPGASPLDNSSPWSQPGYVLDSPTSLKSTNHRQLKTRANKLSLQRLLTKTVVETSDVPADAPVVVDRKRHIPCSEFATTGTDEVESRHNVTTSQELLKLFSQIRMLEERHNQALHLTTALHEELMQAHARVRELELPDRMARREVERLQSTHEAEKLSWRVKEKEKIQAAVQSVKAQLEEERKEKKRLESANRKVTKELMEAKSETSRALQELENERKTRQLMQEVCTKLAQETGNVKAEAEEMKRQTQREQDELEEERRMLQLAEVRREERVQMKLGEARLAFEDEAALEAEAAPTVDKELLAPSEEEALIEAEVAPSVDEKELPAPAVEEVLVEAEAALVVDEKELPAPAEEEVPVEGDTAPAVSKKDFPTLSENEAALEGSLNSL